MAKQMFRMRYSDERQKLMEQAASVMERRGVPSKHVDGTPNDTLILEYALRQLVMSEPKRGKGGKDG